jgi:hypothetical protein
MRWRGVLSILLLVLAWLALDDITTDNATTFVLEYSILVVCGVWFTGVAVWLLARRRPALGIHVVAVALALRLLVAAAPECAGNARERPGPGPARLVPGTRRLARRAALGRATRPASRPTLAGC